MESGELKELISKYLILLDKEEPRPPMILSVGTHQYGSSQEDTEFATAGNFSVISGAGKSRKSYFKSLLVASYIGGNAHKYANDIKSHRKKDMFILDFDTEQSRFHASRVFKRIEKLTNGKYKRYLPFALRQMDYIQRLEFIDNILSTQKNIGLVIIDGIADLVSNVNDLDECNRLVQKLLEWTDKTQCHIITVIHTNYDSGKATGHLGSAVMKKAETISVLKADKSTNTTTIEFTQTRGYPIDSLILSVDKNGLPNIGIAEEVPY